MGLTQLARIGAATGIGSSCVDIKEFPDTEFEMEKPVFEMNTEQGPCLPDFLMHVRAKGEVGTWVVEVMGFDRPDYLAGKEVTHERMEELGPLILMDGKRFERDLSGEGRKVTVEAPKSLRQQLAEMCSRLAAHHRAGLTSAGDGA